MSLLLMNDLKKKTNAVHYADDFPKALTYDFTIAYYMYSLIS